MDIKYAAGFLDGEGSIGLYLTQYKNGSTAYQVTVSISNTNIEILEEFKKSFNGQVNKLAAPRPNCKQAYRWRVVSQQALSFLNQVIPYLVIKKPQAELAISFQGRLKLGGRKRLPKEETMIRNTYINEIKTLNQRGVA